MLSQDRTRFQALRTPPLVTLGSVRGTPHPALMPLLVMPVPCSPIATFFLLGALVVVRVVMLR